MKVVLMCRTCMKRAKRKSCEYTDAGDENVREAEEEKEGDVESLDRRAL